MRIRCLRPVLWRGKVHPPGDIIELDDGAALRLCGAGVAEEASAKSAPAPAAEAAAVEEKPKAKPRKKAARKKTVTK